MNPGLSLDRIGQALAAFYDDLVAEGVPEHLAALVRQVKPSASDAHTLEVPPGTAGLHKSGRLALIVEDEAATRALAESLFEPTDLDAVGCDSAEAALDILRERGADVALVFADVRLAGAMDGLQLAKAVSTLWPRCRMVVTSGRAIARPGDLPSEAVFIPKPWSPHELLVEAERAVEPKPILP
ncbi:response regulator [Methylobacterium sp.]|uniref:response regulator n=1 Tax=Methylobacterium sp. TaxID=409 RepID=UPI003451E91F